MLEAMNNFINRFTTEDKDTLYCPSSGAPVPSSVENDILMSEIGKKAHKQAGIQTKPSAFTRP